MRKTIEVILAVLAGFVLASQAVTYASQLYETVFQHITVADGFSVGVVSTTVVSDVNTDRAFLSLVNTGNSAVACYPLNGVSTYNTGGGWYLTSNGGSVTFDGPSVYGGKVVCLTGSGTTTVGVVEN